LAGKPDLRGISGDFEVNNPSAIEAEHDQGIKELERRGGDDKHINRRKVGQVVTDDRSVRAFAVKPRAFGAPLCGVGT